MKELIESGLSERRSCALAGIRRSSYRYEEVQDRDAELLETVRELARKHPRFGYRRIWALLRRSGRRVNPKRIFRLWKQAGLALARKARCRRRRVGTRSGPLRAAYPRHVVTYDFMFARTVDGRSLKILTVVDEYTREALAIAVGDRMTAVDVIRVLKAAFEAYGWPAFLRSDNGSEFVAEVVHRWLAQHGVLTHHIDPASPWQNPYGESFNEKLRSECLNLEAFLSAEEAQPVLEAWRTFYNEERPHSSLEYRTPVEVHAAWERTRKELSFPPAPGSLRSSWGEGGREGKTVYGSRSGSLTV